MNLFFKPTTQLESPVLASSDASAGLPSLAQRVYGEQIHTLYESMGYSLKSSVFTTLLTVLVCQIWAGWVAALAWGGVGWTVRPMPMLPRCHSPWCARPSAPAWA